MTTSLPPGPTAATSRPELRERVQGLKLPPPQAPAGGGRGGWLLSVFCLALAGWFFALWWFQSGDLFFRTTREPEPAAASEPEAGAALGPTTRRNATAKSAPDAIALQAKGYIIPAHQILVSPKVSGMITHLAVEEGLRVQKGSILAEIETTEFQADHDRARANRDLNQQKLFELEHGSRPEEILQAQAELAEARAALAELDDLFQRQVSLKKSGASTEAAYVSAESKAQAQRKRIEQFEQALKLMKDGPRIERIEAARAELRQTEAELARAQWRLNNCTIRAPISGTILKKNAEEGNIVNPVAFNGSYSLCDMADLADLEVSLDIAERDISKAFPGQRCEVRAEAWPDRSYPGIVDRLMPIADRAKGAIPVRVKVQVPKDEEGVYLKPEMGAIVTFFGAQEPGVPGTSEIPPPAPPLERPLDSPAESAADGDAGPPGET